MPAPPRTSIGEIVDTARALIETEGPNGLTMEKVAIRVGVRAPSLYKHVGGRAELMRLVLEDVLQDLASVLRDAVTGISPESDLRDLAVAFRAFAERSPQSYRLVFAPLPDEWRPDPDVFEAAVAPVMRTVTSLVGETKALEAARLVTAWAHGFMSMELAGAFRMGGDLEEAFEFGLDHLISALTRTSRPSSATPMNAG